MPTDLLRTRDDAAVAAEILRWPADADRREELRRHGHPRLLLLDPGAVPPEREDDREDWLWTPTDERDLFARLNRLTMRSRARATRSRPEVVLTDGIVELGDQRVVLPPAEAAILGVLADAPGRLRSRAVLEAAVWGHRPHGPRALDSRMFTLRARIAPLGLQIHSVRGRGFTLDPTTHRLTEENP